MEWPLDALLKVQTAPKRSRSDEDFFRLAPFYLGAVIALCISELGLDGLSNDNITASCHVLLRLTAVAGLYSYAPISFRSACRIVWFHVKPIKSFQPESTKSSNRYGPIPAQVPTFGLPSTVRAPTGPMDGIVVHLR